MKFGDLKIGDVFRCRNLARVYTKVSDDHALADVGKFRTRHFYPNDIVLSASKPDCCDESTETETGHRMTNLKRYKEDCSDDGVTGDCGRCGPMKEDPDGEWVKLEDIKSLPPPAPTQEPANLPQPVPICPTCHAEWPDKLSDGRFCCTECDHVWKPKG